MLRLTRLEAPKRQITNLTGLEHAAHLKYLDLWENQIRNITPSHGFDTIEAHKPLEQSNQRHSLPRRIDRLNGFRSELIIQLTI